MTEATSKLIHNELDVNSWEEIDPDVSTARPSHCPRCGVAAHDGDRLRLHGHGRRTRDLWGAREVDARPEIWSIQLRRYRCVVCSAVCTVAPLGVATAMRYALTAIATALLLWALRSWTAEKTRRAISPNARVGLSDPRRWRSLTRWSLRSSELFGLPRDVHGTTARDVSRRVAHVLVGRGPPGLDEPRRAWLGACAR